MCKGEKRALDCISVPFKMVILAMELRSFKEQLGGCPRPSIVSLQVRLKTVGSVQLLYWQCVVNNLLVYILVFKIQLSVSEMCTEWSSFF